MFPTGCPTICRSFLLSSTDQPLARGELAPLGPHLVKLCAGMLLIGWCSILLLNIKFFHRASRLQTLTKQLGRYWLPWRAGPECWVGSYESVNPLSDEQHCGWDGNITAHLMPSVFLGARREGGNVPPRGEIVGNSMAGREKRIPMLIQLALAGQDRCFLP